MTKSTSAAAAVLFTLTVQCGYAFFSPTTLTQGQLDKNSRHLSSIKTLSGKISAPSSGYSGSSGIIGNVIADEYGVDSANVFSLETEAVALETSRSSLKSYLSNYEGETGASIVYSKLLEHGVEVVNGYSGGAIMPVLDQFHKDHPRHGGDSPAIRWITNSNENSAGHIAEGYAKSAPASPRDGLQPAGVAIATSGPGVTNLITPIMDAMCDGVPMVVMCGQAATTVPPDAFQSCPAVAMTSPCTKWSYQIKSAAEVPFVMDYAFFIARNGRPGPVFIDLPKDLQNQMVDDDLIQSYTSSVPVKGSENDNAVARFMPTISGLNGHRTVDYTLHLGKSDLGILFDVSEENLTPVTKDLFGGEGLYQLDHHQSDTIFTDGMNREGKLKAGSGITQEMLDMITQAEKPMIIAGTGCNDCPRELKEFAEALNIPVATTLHALGCFDERHDLALNMIGMHGHPSPNYMAQEADLIICIGSRFDDRITGRLGDFAPEAKKAHTEGRGGIIHVDIRMSEKSKIVAPTFFVHSTGKKFLKTMNEELKSRDITSEPVQTAQWLKRMKSMQHDFPVRVPQFATQHISTKNVEGQDISIPRTPMSAQSVVSELNKQLLEAGVMDNTVLATGVGVHQMVAAQLVTWTQPRQMISSGSLGTMGVALGFVIGCVLANVKKMCIAIDGDGSFNMTFTELKTVKEQKIPIKIMVLDNESQMMVEYWQKLFQDDRLIAVTNDNPDYSTLADAFNIKNLYVDAQEDLPEKMREFLFEDPDKPVLMHVKIERTPCLPLVAPGKPLQEMILEDGNYEGLDKSAAPS